MAKDKQRLIRISGGLSPATDAWQIGATVPPKNCLCCGRSFTVRTRKMKGPYRNGPYRYVCEPCWALPFVFFPDKVRASCGECWVPRGQTRHKHFEARDRMYPRRPKSATRPSRSATENSIMTSSKTR